jgi:hypothetical protein
MDKDQQNNPEVEQARYGAGKKLLHPDEGPIPSEARNGTPTLPPPSQTLVWAPRTRWVGCSLKWVILGLVILVVIVFIFGVGIFVGERKARFSYRWAEQYHRNFAGPRAGFFDDWRSFPGGDFIGAHGVFGQIIKIDPSTNSGQATLIIKGGDNVEKIVLVKDDTVIKSLQNTLKLSDVKVDDYIVVIGEPNDAGQIEAKFIRLLPPPGENSFNMFLPRRPGPNL